MILLEDQDILIVQRALHWTYLYRGSVNFSFGHLSILKEMWIYKIDICCMRCVMVGLGSLEATTQYIPILILRINKSFVLHFVYCFTC